jgi:molybdopterin-containing oxidoreductase family membrane subunit
MTTKSVAKQNLNVSPLTWLILAAVGLGGTGAAWGMQLSRGMAITGLGQQVVWGLYIAGFFTAMGVGAALVSFAAASEFSTHFPVERRSNALLLALASFVIGGLLISMDVGNPVNLWRILTAGRFTSMMTWDFWLLVITGVLCLIYLIVSWNQKAGTSATRLLAVLTSAAALVMVAVESWMLASLSAHPLWGGGLTLVSFLVAALVGGLAMAMLAWDETIPDASLWLKAGLWITLILVAAEIFTALVETGIRPYPEVSLLVTGALSPMFWTYLIGGLLLPLGILLWTKELTWLRVAAVLALLGVIAEKLWLLAAGQARPWLALPEEIYAPTWSEWLGILGCIALLPLLYLFIRRFIKADQAQ